jgi:hypothetical protein
MSPTKVPQVPGILLLQSPKPQQVDNRTIHGVGR